MQKRILVDALGKWLNEFCWNWFITLTFRKPQSLQTAIHAFKGLMRKLRTGVNYFRVIEDANNPNLIHIHALIKDEDVISTPKVIESKWHDRHGKATVSRYDKTKGAAYYINKHINSDKMDWDFHIVKKAEREVRERDRVLATLIRDL